MSTEPDTFETVLLLLISFIAVWLAFSFGVSVFKDYTGRCGEPLSIEQIVPGELFCPKRDPS